MGRFVSAWAVALLGMLGFCCSTALSEDTVELPSRLDRSVLLIAPKEKPGDTYAACSATVVASGDTLYFVVHGPTAPGFSAQTAVGAPDTPTRSSQWFPLKEVSNWADGDPWVHLERLGVSILRLRDRKPANEHLEHLRELSIPLEGGLGTSPRRTTQVEIVGYTELLHSREKQVKGPFVYTSFVCSKNLHSPVDVPESMLWIGPLQGYPYAGGPVFVHEQDETTIRWTGVFLGNYSEEGEGSIGGVGLVVPAAKIVRAIRMLQKEVVSTP